MATKDQELAAHIVSVQAMLISLMERLALKGVLAPDDFEPIIKRAIAGTHDTDALIAALAEQKLQSMLPAQKPSGEAKP